MILHQNESETVNQSTMNMYHVFISFYLFLFKCHGVISKLPLSQPVQNGAVAEKV